MRSTRMRGTNKTGKGLLNTGVLNRLPFEAHVPDKGVNPLDSACRKHNIAYLKCNNLDIRRKADQILGEKGQERTTGAYSSRKEKIDAHTVMNTMKAKRKIAAKKKRKPNKKNGGMRFISTPRQTGGVIPLVPIFAGLTALGSLMSGGASVYNAIQNSKRKKGSGKGSHWVAFYKNKDKVVYFDKFGNLAPPIELQKYLKGNKIKYNYTNYQNKNTFNCGHLCLNFLQCKNHLNGNTTTLSVHYFPPIDVYDDSEIALLNLQTYNTFPNINETNNHFEIHLENPDRLLNNNKFPACFITLKKGNDLEYLEIEKITFDIGIDQVDFRTTIFSNGTICFNVENSIAPLFGFEKKIMNTTLMVIDHRKCQI
ncbi:hypothetical protein AGLY_017496 [Aphis glycines]|uniref:Uncharacterized protein n=1 Tax=Aphis glycines TaxID=307491 RepID=A0A6G0SVC9_APHGL|nr:hypothetical protein AGLY_017496 [Aphis glycines]